jgi:hypothetical protein
MAPVGRKSALIMAAVWHVFRSAELRFPGPNGWAETGRHGLQNTAQQAGTASRRGDPMLGFPQS